MQRGSGKGKKAAPIICAAVAIALFGTILAVILIPLIDEARGERVAIGFLILYGGFIVAAIIGVIAALRQRIQEIERGEEEDAKKY